MKCPKCQHENPGDSTFCGRCATRLDEDAPPSITKTITNPPEEITRGTLFAGRYEVIEELGQGGMGRVYRVEDIKVKEEVALKLIRPEISADGKTIDRFRNELKIARKIRHKNITGMYDLGEYKGIHYITMEYVSGQDLRGLIRQTGQLTVGKTVAIGKEIAEGLGEAHKLGVVHRDLKPSNIMIDKQGRARIMDFGIALSIESKDVTGLGKMIGTPDYMSPEQVEGKDLDLRSDIYSFGILLYEMATGHRPFTAETPIALGVKHKTEAPEDPRNFNSHISENLSHLILKCLEKDKEDRYQNTEELLGALSHIEEEIPTTDKELTHKKTAISREITFQFSPRKIIIPILAIIGVLAIAIISNYFYKKLAVKTIQPEHKQLTFSGNSWNPAISPDGKLLAYIDGKIARESKIIVQDLLSEQTLVIYEGFSLGGIEWLPDGSELSVADGRQLHILSRLGGEPRTLKVNTLGGYCWSPDGSRLACCTMNENRIYFVDKMTEESTYVEIDVSFHFLWKPNWSPKGNLLSFVTIDDNNTRTLWTVPIKGGKPHKIYEALEYIVSPQWSVNGDATYFIIGSKLYKTRVSPKTGEAIGDPIILLSDINFGQVWNLCRDGKSFVYTRELNYSNIWLAKLKDSDDNTVLELQELTSGTNLYGEASISPDGKMVAFSRGNPKVSNIFTMPISGGTPRQLTFFECINNSPVWSPDGQEIAFVSREGGEDELWKVDAKGGKPFRFEGNKAAQYNICWAPGPLILSVKSEGKRGSKITATDPETGEELHVVGKGIVGMVGRPRWAPDGKEIAFRWSRGDKSGIWLISFDDMEPRFLSEWGVIVIGWSNDGKWIYATDSRLISYRKINRDNRESQLLPDMPFNRVNIYQFYPSVGPDGKTFIGLKNENVKDVWIVKNFDPDI